MILKSLRLHAFRAHQETRLEFAPGVNLLYGPNGAGKTNVLEAIHYLCLTKSFLTGQDNYAIQRGASFFEVEGQFEGERRADLRVRLAYVPEEGKRVFLNGAPAERLADLVGVLPVVVFSPEDQVLTSGGPEERRRFLNNILSQSKAVYLEDVLDYRRTLRQRNELLAQHRRSRTTPPRSVQEAWDAELVALGSRIIAARARFVRGFADHLEAAYRHIADVAEQPSIRYETVAPLDEGDGEDEIADRYRRVLQRLAPRERERGMTLAGPHRDELVFYLNEFEVRRYASQGQHRTFGMALKLAQYFYLHDYLEESPILLLDDIFDHLDEHRTSAFLRLLQSQSVKQSILTATRIDLFAQAVPFAAPGNRAVRIESGRPIPEPSAEM